MQQLSKRRHYNIAMEMGLVYAILILYTLLRRVPDFLTLWHLPGTQLLRDHQLIFTLGETLFISAGLLALYGLISLWLAELRFILWAGLSLVVVAGLVYLLGAVTYYQTQGIGPAITRGALMFLLSLVIPFLTGRLVMHPRDA